MRKKIKKTRSTFCHLDTNSLAYISRIHCIKNSIELSYINPTQGYFFVLILKLKFIIWLKSQS